MPCPPSATCEQNPVERPSQTSVLWDVLPSTVLGGFTQCIYCSLNEVTLNTLQETHCKQSFSMMRNKDASCSLRTSCPLVSFCVIYETSINLKTFTVPMICTLLPHDCIRTLFCMSQLVKTKLACFIIICCGFNSRKKMFLFFLNDSPFLGWLRLYTKALGN